MIVVSDTSPVLNLARIGRLRESEGSNSCKQLREHLDAGEAEAIVLARSEERPSCWWMSVEGAGLPERNGLD